MGRPIIICTFLTELCFKVEIFSLIAGNAAIRCVPWCFFGTVGHVLVGQRSVGVFLDELLHGDVAQEPAINYQIGLDCGGLKVGICAAVTGDYDVHSLSEKLLIGDISFGLIYVSSEGHSVESLPNLCQFVPNQNQIKCQHSSFNLTHLRACQRCEGSSGKLISRNYAWRTNDCITSDHIQGVSVQSILL